MRVLILGGGIGGHVASDLLSKRLERRHEVVLIDRKTQYEFSPSFLWVTMGWREPSQITRKMSLLEKKGVKYVDAEVLKIDPSSPIISRVWHWGKVLFEKYWLWRWF